MMDRDSHEQAFERSHRYTILSTPYSLLSIFLAIAAVILFVRLAGGQETAKQPSRLPWEAAPLAREPILRPPVGAAEVLERFDIGPSQLDHFVAGPGLTPGETDVLAKILFHLPRLGLENLHRWRQSGPDWPDIIAKPVENRLQVFSLKGHAKRVTKQALLPEQAELYEFGHYFRVEMALDDSPIAAIVAARSIPQAWTLDADMDEPAAADGLFLKTGDPEAKQTELVFAATRVAWFPDQPRPEQHIGPSQVVLSKLGFDAGLWDDVRASPKHSLAAGDREAFYQLLAAVARDRTGEIAAAAKLPIGVVPLLEKPAEHHGDMSRITGTARRVMRVPVSDVDVRVRLGIDYYYEIDMFLPLQGASLRLGKDPTGKKNPVYQNSFPATLIVRKLPPGLAEGENVHAQVSADAAFFKLWSYRADYTAKFGQLQPAPLFMAYEPRLVPLDSQANWVASALVTVALSLALGIAVLTAWWYRAEDRKRRRPTAERLDLRF